MSKKRKPGRRKHWAIGCLAAVLLLIAIVGVGYLVGKRLWQTKPTYWETNRAFVQATPPETLEVLADNAFNRILSELSQSRGYAPQGIPNWQPISDDALGVRVIRMTFDEANAWLAERLDDWLEQQERDMPAGLSNPMLASDDGRLIAAFRIERSDIDQIISVALSMKFLDNGQATMSIDHIWGGSLSIPVGMVMDRLPGGAGNQDSQAVAVLMGQQAFDPILPIDGARRARIIGIEVDETGVGLVVQAEPNTKD